LWYIVYFWRLQRGGTMAAVTSDLTHFATIKQLPTIEVQATVRAAFALMHERPAGGLVTLDEDVPTYYVTGRFLRAGLVVLSKKIGIPSATLTSVAGYLIHFLNIRDPVSKQIRSLGRRGTIPADPNRNRPCA
jgi:hypothetical protein